MPLVPGKPRYSAPREYSSNSIEARKARLRRGRPSIHPDSDEGVRIQLAELADTAAPFDLSELTPEMLERRDEVHAGWTPQVKLSRWKAFPGYTNPPWEDPTVKAYLAEANSGQPVRDDEDEQLPDL